MLKNAWKSSDAASKQVIRDHYEKRKAEIEIGGARGFNPAKPKENLASDTVDTPNSEKVKSQSITDFE